ncbi:hypothetical protein EVAR_2234_1 [Eumeta japonica]|uniref:Uncharacterized protein n=1 Tax=Eumeta variegata TaxID=151549 RepID=A0A4C1SFH9_EUMVA|nr:hypothetical protein EVAR_2234_1 [Eumeta japonica]
MSWRNKWTDGEGRGLTQRSCEVTEGERRAKEQENYHEVDGHRRPWTLATPEERTGYPMETDQDDKRGKGECTT